MAIRFDAVRQTLELRIGLDFGPAAQVEGRLLLRGAQLEGKRHRDEFIVYGYATPGASGADAGRITLIPGSTPLP